MGWSNVILDIKVTRNNDCIILSPTHYVEKMLKIVFEHFDYLPMSTTYDSKIYLVKNRGDGVKSLVAWCFDKLYTL
jgi:hypothetical protein